MKVVISLLLAGVLLISAAGLMLKRGVSLESLEIAGAQLSGCTLVWREKLELQVEMFALDVKTTSWNLQQNLDAAKKAVSAASRLIHLFSSLHVNSFSVGEWQGTIHLDRNAAPGDSLISIGSKDLEFLTGLKLEGDIMILDISKVAVKTLNAQASGQVRIDTRQEQMSGTLAVNFADVFPVTVEFEADKRQLVFSGQEGGKISTIKPLVDLFELDQGIQVWITEYLVGSRYNLKTVSGVLPWDNPGAILDSLYGEVRVDDCEYTFAPGLEPIKTRYTDVVFKNGVLIITPTDSTFYGQNGEASWLDIDFNDGDNIILTAYIKTHAKANDDILNLLKYYDILLPLRQESGVTAADLTLVINLNSEQVGADGSFLIDKGRVAYSGVIYDVTEVDISVDDSMVTIDNIDARYAEMFDVRISGVYNGAEETGELYIVVEHFESPVGNSKLRLDTARKQPSIVYRILPDSQFLEVAGSSWYLEEQQFNIGPFSTPFSFYELSGTLPPTKLEIPPGIIAELSGPFSISKQQVSLECALLDFRMKDIVLEEAGLPFTILQNGRKWKFQTAETSHWSINEVPVTLYNSEFIYTESAFSVTGSRVRYGDFFDSEVTGYYDTIKEQGLFFLEKLSLKNQKIGTLFDADQGVWIEINRMEEGLAVKIPELEFYITAGKDGHWSATLNDISRIYDRSPLLQKYKVDEGNAAIWAPTGDKPFSFSAVLPYRYPILVKDGKNIDQLLISGSITEHGFGAMVNEDLLLDYTDTLAITSTDIHYNIPAINKLLGEQPVEKDSDDAGDTGLKLSFVAENSSLIFTERIHVPADEIHLNSAGGRTVGHLHHGQGTIELTLEDGRFSLEGKDLNDAFIGALLQGAGVRNGHMSLAAQGTLDYATALFKVNDTVLMDFKPLNNMLAFMNTVPALITFSPQEYSTRGLPVSSAVTGLVFDNGVAAIESFSLRSPVITLNGAGEVDFTRNKMDMDFNVITQAKVNINKIPLLGYIFAGKEKRPSIALKVTGGLDDPEVDYSVFREVAILPFSILYRTLTLPYHLVDTMIESNDIYENGRIPPISDVEQGGEK